MTDEANITRRSALLRMGATASAALVAPLLAGTPTPAQAHSPSEYRESKMPYDWSALEGFLSAKVLQEHYEKHQRTHVREANRLVKEIAKARVAGKYDGINETSKSLAFHASSHLLHNIYWRSMNPYASAEPKGDVRAHVEENFGSAGGFKDHLRAAAQQFGGEGWVVTSWDPMTGRMFIFAIEKDNLASLQGSAPLLAIDLWKHAYEADYGDRRRDYVEKFLERLDWDFLGLQLVRQH